VTAEWRRYELPLGPLAPGETTLTLACRGPAIVANDVLHNDDPRALGLAVGSWRIEDVGAGRGARASPLAVEGPKATSAARLAPHEGHSPRPLQENATRNSSGQLRQRTLAKPLSQMPRSR
jgi:hypothetical protein